MGYLLGKIELQHKNGDITLEQRGKGVEFVLKFKDKEEFIVFKIADEELQSLVEMIQHLVVIED